MQQDNFLHNTVETLFSLDEPWRTRFLILTATSAAPEQWPEQWDERIPSQEEIIDRLQKDISLALRINLMLQMWIKNSGDAE